MKKIWFDRAWDDYLYWQTHNKQILKKINTLVKEIERNPFDGLGKAEPLRGDYSGFWSRRITDEHRLIYRIVNGTLEILTCMGHYDD